jgi:formamidopyrimidine-DNA glycosylase
VPELPEVEAYRRLAEAALGRRIERVDVPDPHCLRHGTTVRRLRAQLPGADLLAARRKGKLLLLDTTQATLGLHFGMTGRLVVGADPVLDADTVADAASAEEPRWLRFRIGFRGGSTMGVDDARRLGRVELDPDETRLGPDTLTLTLPALRQALQSVHARPGVALKARIMDQSKLAGIGNLAADEILWRAGLSPRRPSNQLSDDEARRLHRTIRTTMRRLVRLGGVHLGEVVEHRRAGERCPRDGTPMRRDVIAGRSTWWCPSHQL